MQPLIEDIKQKPLDLHSRLILADWYEDKGNYILADKERDTVHHLQTWRIFKHSQRFGDDAIAVFCNKGTDDIYVLRPKKLEKMKLGGGGYYKCALEFALRAARGHVWVEITLEEILK